jgi:uncharacterized protein
MKKWVLLLVSFFSLAWAIGQNVLPKPNPPRLVNDAANVLSPQEVAALEHKLVALDDSSSNQIAIVLIKTLGDYAIEDYAVKLFREWGIGNKKTNNGVLIIAAIDDHKVWIEVGYGLEGAIPDIVASTIYHDEIIPSFKEQKYYEGLDKGIDALTKAAVGEYKVKTNRSVKSKSTNGKSIFTFLIIVFVIIMFLSRGNRGGGGGGMGGLAEGLLLGSLLSGGRGGGGGWGGGDSGGGGGDFGGFGGGDTGGGGAGGSW